MEGFCILYGDRMILKQGFFARVGFVAECRKVLRSVTNISMILSMMANDGFSL